MLNNTLNTYDSEPEWQQCARYLESFGRTASLWLPPSDISAADNTTLHLAGTHGHITTIVDTVINETGAVQRPKHWT